MGASPRATPVHHNAPNAGFVFIQTSYNGSVKDKRTQRTIKKHVMRDIGKARRIYDISDDEDLDELFPEDSASEHKVVKAHDRPSSSGARTHGTEFEARSFLSDVIQINSETEIVGPANHSNKVAPPYSLSTEHDSTVHDDMIKDFCSFAASPASLLDSFHGDPFAKYPLQLSLPMKRLISLSTSTPKKSHVTSLTISSVFDTTLPPNLTQYRETWYWIALENAASFYQVLSNFALHILSITTAIANRSAKRKNHFISDEESLGYHLMAVKHVNSKLGSLKEGDWIDDGIIGAVAGFVCYAHLTQDWTAWRSHMEGLKALVKRRGGIWTIEKNVPLASVLIL